MTNQTNRVCSLAIDKTIGDKYELLDHGFIRVIDYMGNDDAIVQAARVSYGKGTKTINKDEGLIRYLLRHRHTTPLEMCEIKFHIKMPMFVARQWIRHRTANVNEYSARYSELENEFYIPTPEQLAGQSTINAQGKQERPLSQDEADKVIEILKNDSERCYDNYKIMLNEYDDGEKINPDHEGLARELARMNLPANIYTEWYWKIDLHNLLHFLSLRADSHAQYEIRVYADLMLNTIVKAWCPITYQAFLDYRKNSFTVSSQELELLKRSLKGEAVDYYNSGISKREADQLIKTFEI